VKIHATQRAIVDTFRENFHGTYTDFAVSFCENSRHAHITTHRRYAFGYRRQKRIGFVNVKTS